MAQLLVRGVGDKTLRALREQAKANGRSVEAEHRAILEAALANRVEMMEFAATLQEMTWLAELDPDRLRDNDPPREFDWP
jgi:plasmid stability protein